MNPRPAAIGLAALALIWSLAACGSTEPNEFTLQNSIDDFQYQVRSVSNWTATREYTWQNTGTVASVDQSSFIQAGSATLTILDATGVQVYSENQSVVGLLFSDPGTAGSWKIRLTTSNVSGTITFRVLGGN